MSKEGSRKTYEIYLRTTQLVDTWMDKLLPNWQYEEVLRRIWTVAQTQGESSDTKAMEEADAYISEPSETKPNHRMWVYTRRNLQGCEQQTRMVQKKRNVCSEFCNQSRDTWTQNKEPTRTGRPAAILFE